MYYINQSNTILHKQSALRLSQPATSLKKRLWHRCFPVNSAKFLKTFFYRTHPGAASEISTFRGTNIRFFIWEGNFQGHKITDNQLNKQLS